MALRAHSTYAYVNLGAVQVFVNSDDLNDTGAWSSSVSYAAGEAALYNGAYYYCLSPNINTAPNGNVSADWSVIVLVRDGSGDAGHSADEAYALADSAQITANEALALAQSGGTAASSGSDYTFRLFTTGTDYTQTQVSTEATIRASADLSEAVSRVFGDGTTLAAANAYTDTIFTQGTGYTNTQVQQGSNYAFSLYTTGTAYAHGQDLTVAQQGSQFSVILRDQGTAYAQSLVSAEAVARDAADSLVRSDGTIFTVTQVGAESTARFAADAVVAQQGSQYAHSLFDQGTNYTDSSVAAEAASRVTGDYSTFTTGTAYTDAQIANVQVSSGSSSLAVYWAGTNYTNAQVLAEAVARTAADAVVAQQGSNYAFSLYTTGTNYAHTQDLIVAQQGSQFSVILRDQGTNASLPITGGTLTGGLVAPSVTSNVWINPQTIVTFGTIVNLDFNVFSASSVTFTGTGTFTTSNRSAGRMKKVRIISDGTSRTFGFPGGWTFLGAAAPVSIAASKIAILSVECWGSNDSDIIAAYAVQI